MSWLDEMEAADSAYPGDVSYPAARTRAGRGLYQLHAGLDDGHLKAARDLIAEWSGAGVSVRDGSVTDIISSARSAAPSPKEWLPDTIS